MPQLGLRLEKLLDSNMSAPPSPPDLVATIEHIRTGRTTARAELEHSLQAAQSAACAHAYRSLDVGACLQALERPGLASTPLAGLAVSIKDLFDVAGEVTAAGSVVLDDQPPAAADAPAVARLRAAGATLVGRTNMVEFAFSGVGINPHFGTPANPAFKDRPHIPGGSSSGAAVSVAAGAAWVGLGSDTGGSIRIPAALCGIVGFKSTQSLVPLAGALPLSTTLDTVCAMTRSVRDAILVHEILADRQVARSVKPVSALRLAVVRDVMCDAIEPAVAQAFERSVERLSMAGATVVDVPAPLLAELSQLQATGGFTAAESFAWHRHLLETRADQYDPRVSQRIARGAAMKAYEYLDLHRERAAWIARVRALIDGYDAVLSPTVPMLAPSVSQVAPGAERDAEFFRVNGLLLRNTSVVNMLDGCALSMPCQLTGDAPVGLMLWAGAHRDDRLLGAALTIESALAA